MLSNFSGSNRVEYYWSKPHYNLGNKLVHSNFYKTFVPWRSRYEYNPDSISQLPWYFQTVPQESWLYGNIDYNMNKFHKHYQKHDDWYPDRKNKSLGFREGGDCDPLRRNSIGMTISHIEPPRGCTREIQKFKRCEGVKGADQCQNEKVSIMEVCPDHVLQGLRERRKWFLRAKSIDNATYKRAMRVSDYNKGRSVSDLKLKTWEDGMAHNLRPDGYWVDNRYDPKAYRHPHRVDTVNFPDHEYKDIFGGTWGKAEQEEKDKHALSFWSQKSAAMEEREKANKQ